MGTSSYALLPRKESWICGSCFETGIEVYLCCNASYINLYNENYSQIYIFRSFGSKCYQYRELNDSSWRHESRQWATETWSSHLKIILRLNTWILVNSIHVQCWYWFIVNQKFLTIIWQERNTVIVRYGRVVLFAPVNVVRGKKVEWPQNRCWFQAKW